MTNRRVVLVLASALIGFGFGFGLLFQLSPHSVWFAANTPGLWIFSRFVNLDISVWMIPLGNAIAYGMLAVLFISVTGLAQWRGKRTSV